jgi:biotin carboxyl carrier protein
MKEFKYTIDGKEYNVEIGDINEETYVANVKVNGEDYQVQMEKPAEPEKKKVVLGKPAAADNSEEASAPAANVDSSKATKAPLPGTITAINLKVGDKVKAGDTVVVLEAMKMANNMEAEKDGTVTAICVKVGQSVMEDDPLFVVE